MEATSAVLRKIGTVGRVLEGIAEYLFIQGDVLDVVRLGGFSMLVEVLEHEVVGQDIALRFHVVVAEIAARLQPVLLRGAFRIGLSLTLCGR